MKLIADKKDKTYSVYTPLDCGAGAEEVWGDLDYSLDGKSADQRLSIVL
jgi:hypothetical protein